MLAAEGLGGTTPPRVCSILLMRIPSLLGPHHDAILYHLSNLQPHTLHAGAEKPWAVQAPASADHESPQG